MGGVLGLAHQPGEAAAAQPGGDAQDEGSQQVPDLHLEQGGGTVDVGGALAQERDDRSAAH